MSSWKNVKTERDTLFQGVVDKLTPAEKEILFELMKLEAEQRGLTAPRIKGPLRDLVEGKIP